MLNIHGKYVCKINVYTKLLMCTWSVCVLSALHVHLHDRIDENIIYVKMCVYIEHRMYT